MEQKKSASLQERIKGNKLYIDAGAQGLSPVLKRGRLESAMAAYIRAENLASNVDELSSASKNHGKAAWHLSKTLREEKEHPIQVIYYLKEAIKSFSVAYNKGLAKEVDWREDVLRTLNTCLGDLIQVCEQIPDTDERFKILTSFTDIVTVNSAAVELQLNLATFLFHDGAQKIQQNDYRGALSRLRDCYRPIEEARRLNRDTDEFCRDQDIRILEKDVYFNTCSAESIQAREYGHQLLDIATLDEESLNMNLVWDAIDWYKRAAILTRELDLEQEAIALSHLGFVYNKVLKLKYKSKEYYKKCFELAESMKPRTFFTQDWYQQCVSTLQEFQLEERLRDEKEKQKEREKKLEEIREELEDLKKNNTGKSEISIHVYNTYPPKNPKWVKPSEEDMAKWAKMEMKELKKVLLKGINAYHPDKIDAEEHGEKWKTLCEEITKLLTAHYEFTKVG
ncbi:uncharacterized protein LOC116294175 [Actinia tenebrosa]|uniref:Uncharacterized protein LOC116294175 n=1 Tax=Actinia tenebrosa TaxID=6105 RepID=A0A6P8HR57_ACTTE|nr:uncharacterized protein LOC116294175 [Actinia tenebrosa]